MLTIKEAMNWRYATKKFNPDKKISQEDFSQLEAILQLAPTSTNIQPTYFIVADNEEGKKRIAKGAIGPFAYNRPKIMNASHVIVFTSKKYVDDDHLSAVLEKEDEDGRFSDEQWKENQDTGRRSYLRIHRLELQDEAHWHAKQCYLAVGALLLGAASMAIDAVPMEGIDLDIINQEFDLNAQNISAQMVVALGYRQEKEDYNTKLPKSRLDKNLRIIKA
ncbi:oxygen-insensitive NAD(P)H nitroreductase [Streptococcus pacificus]|uniref:Oxygen-insensitive NAD(P)H nitroreductase n=1 Tax=Streptococcus pacificus TaxID=2740577 RepID=A0ABS0ZHD8_9STRE|nr:oxygen-insensitive NAD(P)H nitroreductase [Streptococcus pacificus]MBJ8325273.1 oxygen-insensitive NAD(P)H nitroreductase [Streptococcus pacificus]